MTDSKKVLHAVPAESLTRLNPNKLGRHHHRIPQHIKEAKHKYPRVISDYFLRHFRINLDLNHIEILQQDPRAAECIYRCPLGKVGFSIDRPLLTETLECYYGGCGISTPDTPPISISEQRMRERIGLAVCEIFGLAIVTGTGFGRLERQSDAYEEINWEYMVELRFGNHASSNESSLYIYLDGQLADELTSLLAGPPPPRMGGDPLDSIKHLPVQLQCVLASVQMPLIQVLGLQAGDILTVRLREQVEVCINQQPLFRGAIFEDDGTLFLTSAEMVIPHE